MFKALGAGWKRGRAAQAAAGRAGRPNSARDRTGRNMPLAPIEVNRESGRFSRRFGPDVRELTQVPSNAYAELHQRCRISRWPGLETSETRSGIRRPVSPQLAAAIDRLDAALDRLEGSIGARESQLATEREQVADELREAQSTQAALQAEARSVSSRLDAAIGRLRAVLEA
jgi:hypothetical protein